MKLKIKKREVCVFIHNLAEGGFEALQKKYSSVFDESTEKQNIVIVNYDYDEEDDKKDFLKEVLNYDEEDNLLIDGKSYSFTTIRTDEYTTCKELVLTKQEEVLIKDFFKERGKTI